MDLMDKRREKEKRLMFEYGKMPPQSVDMEVAVLGALILSSDAIVQIADKLKPEHFYKESHKLIYKAIYDMHNDGESDIDILTISHKLKSRQEIELVGGAYYLGELTQKVGGAQHIESHAAVIISKYILRTIIEISSDYTNKSFDQTIDGEELINSMGSELINITENMYSGIEPISDVSDENYKRIMSIRDGSVKSFGIPTMLTDLDNIINGLQAPDLIVIAGRPGMGKTALMINLIRSMSVDRNIPCAIFSLEMSSMQLELRIQTLLSGIAYFNLQNGRFNDNQLEAYQKGRSAVKTAPIYIDDDSRNTIETIRTKAIQFKNKYGIEAIFVDYLQLMDGAQKGINREGQISSISRGLKSLAKELSIPIVALSQLNREVEKMNPPLPKLSHLRESGSIEQDSDIVAFLYRPEYYGINTVKDKFDADIETKDLCILDIAKHRNGPTGKIMTKFYTNTMTFADYTNTPEPTDWLEPVAAKQEELFDEPSTDKPF